MFQYFKNIFTNLYHSKYELVDTNVNNLNQEEITDNLLDLDNEFTPYELNGDADSVLKTLLNISNEELKEESNEESKEKLEEELKEESNEESNEESKEDEDTKDEEYKTLFDIISDSELKNGFDMSSFKYVPDFFMEIDTKTFGNSINNPFLKLYEAIVSDKYDYEDRCQGVRYMQRINYVDGRKYCIQAAITILKDEKYPFNKRYYFFSNNDAYVKLDYDIVNECHRYVYDNFEQFNAPLLYKLLSAQFILAHFVPSEYDRLQLQNFLLSIAEDNQQTINYRAECADILYNYGVEKDFVYASQRIIKELGELYTQNKSSTIYTNVQNVHDTTINKNIINTLRQLIQTVKPMSKDSKKNTGEVLEVIRNKYSHLDETRMNKIMSSIERIMIDTAKYELLSISDILVLVWEYICQSEHKDELENRLIQELEEMDETCSTGHLSRILNVLSGYFSDNVVQISLKDQLRSNIFARYSKLIKMLSDELQDKINSELILNESENKDTIKTFLLDYNLEEVLYKEFVIESNMDVSEFYETYEKALEDYFGKLY